MSIRTLIQGLTVAILLVAASAASAHHSFASIWDETRTFTVSGELTRIDWTNPHIYYFVDVKGADGKVERYSFEGLPPWVLRNKGVSKDMLAMSLNKQVTVEGYRAKKDVKTVGFGRALTLADGRTIQMVGDDPRNIN